MDRDPYAPDPYAAPLPEAAPEPAAARYVPPPPAPPPREAPLPATSSMATATTTDADVAPAARSMPWWMQRGNLREWAFIAGLAGGVLIMVGAFAVALFVTALQLVGPVDSNVWFLDDGNFPGAALAVAVWGLVTGGVVLWGALRLKQGDDASALPGALMLIGGILSFFALGGFLVGGLAAIAAGVMAVAGAEYVLPPRDARAPRSARPLP